jgi:hypothetical protein
MDDQRPQTPERRPFEGIDAEDPELDEAGDKVTTDDGVVAMVPGPGGGAPNQPVVAVDDPADEVRTPLRLP